MKGNRKSNKQTEKAKDFKGTAKKIFKKREYTYNSKSVEPDSDPFDSVHHLVILCAKSVSAHNHCDCAFWIYRYY